MLFDRPILFEDAVRSAKAKALLPTDLASKDLAGLRGVIAQNALASARVVEASILQKVADVLQAMIEPKEEDGVVKGMNLATARLEMKQKLAEIGYQPPEGERGRITDLSSDQRINLIVDTQIALNRGYGQFKQGQSAAVLDAYPAQELYRGEPRKEPRPWHEIWPEAANKVDAGAMRTYKETGRFLARKDSPIWLEISDFGLPYPPFKFNSGMRTEDVDRETALQLGLIDEDTEVQSIADDYAQSFQMSADGLTEEMKAKILDQLGSDFTFKGDVLTRA